MPVGPTAKMAVLPPVGVTEFFGIANSAVEKPINADILEIVKAEMDVGTNKKAFQINLDARRYGTFAEIVGGASGTIAKTMSAYDMTFSDAIYGPTDRYVSRIRLGTMLDHEYNLLIERLDQKLGAQRYFFVFADTVAARSFKQHNEAHGWLGVRFQTEFRGEPSQIIIHLRMLDEANVDQQEVLGVIGVNLIYGAFYHAKPEELISSLQENLAPGRIEVDMIKFSGPAFSQVDNRLMSLQLVSQGLTDAVMFQADGETVQPAEVFYKKAILVERGSFRPVTYATNDMLDGARRKFLQESGCAEPELIVLMEMIDEKYYLNLEGGILEALGRMFKGALKLYVYPMIHERSGKIITASQIEVAPNLKALFQFIMDNNFITEITDYHPEYLKIFPPDALAKLQPGDSGWEKMVPPEVTQIIKERGFFGYCPSSAAAA